MIILSRKIPNHKRNTNNKKNTSIIFNSMQVNVTNWKDVFKTSIYHIF